LDRGCRVVGFAAIGRTFFGVDDVLRDDVEPFSCQPQISPRRDDKNAVQGQGTA
jgi:hypothetical protein